MNTNKHQQHNPRPVEIPSAPKCYTGESSPRSADPVGITIKARPATASHVGLVGSARHQQSVAAGW